MSLLPLTVFDCLRRVYRGVLVDSFIHHPQIAAQLAARIIAEASVNDVIRWRGVSRAFRLAAEKRLNAYTKLHIRVVDGLSDMKDKAQKSVQWSGATNVLLIEMDPSSVAICIDSRMTWKDAKAMIALIAVFRRSAEHVFMDSPVVDLLLKHLNNAKVKSLIALLSQERRGTFHSPVSYFLPLEETTNTDTAIAVNESHSVLSGPFFPQLKQFTVTCNKAQLSHLSRILAYCVAVESVFEKDGVDLVCLQVILGDSWCRSKQRMFRHVSSFKHWLDASSLGVKYVQQFQGGAPVKRKRAL